MRNIAGYPMGEKKRIMKLTVMALFVFGFAVVTMNCGKSPVLSTETIQKEIGISRGILALIGDVECRKAIEIAGNTELLIYMQFQNDRDVEAARLAADKAGLYGTRIFIDKGSMQKIHLADNVADALVGMGEASKLARDEALRVIHPEGKALIGGQTYTKPFPVGVDDWSHPYHRPDNNPQSGDMVARAPYLTQFLAPPYYAPMPQMTVSSAGRVFRVLGHIAFKPREEKWTNTLMAINGYNGTILWTRKITPGIMVHRNTLIATPSTLYMGDNQSCKMIDAKTGELKDVIVPPADIAGGTFWKWMALEDDVLYAIIGEDEMRDPEVRSSYSDHGWPWNPLSKGFNLPENPWGYGKNILAINPKTKEIIWNHHENEPIDTRAVAMKNGRMYIFRFGKYLACLDTKSGSEIWRKTYQNDPELFTALGKNLNRQDWQTNWRTTPYLKCSDKALYFAGPMMDKLLVLSASDGSVLWHHPYDNYQLVLRDDGLYGISGPWTNNFSKKFDPLTGKILDEFDIGRRACTRPTGAADAIFYRANGGSVRFDLASQRPQYVSPMRPPCFDGVTIANGYLYWWPSVCDCQLTLYGATCLGPAGDFDFSAETHESERLEKSAGSPLQVANITETNADWPTFRASNTCRATSTAVVPGTVKQLWSANRRDQVTLTAPISVGGMVFFSGSDGIIRAVDAATGESIWSAYTGGGVRIAPTYWEGRIYVGSGDGWVYAFETKTGRQLWRFRAAPEERKIPVYGALLSTWPAASGVLVEDGTAYVAAGISNFDGIHVYALDAVDGTIKWQNNSSGHLNAEARTGVGVQGHLLLHGDRLYLAGGNAVSPAVYDKNTGECLNNGDRLNICESICLRGWELYLIGDKVAVGGQPFYKDPDYPVVDATVTEKVLHTSVGDRDILWMNSAVIKCYDTIDKKFLDNSVLERNYPGHYKIPTWGRLDITNKAYWESNCQGSTAVAVCSNAVVYVNLKEIVAINLYDGTRLWSEPLPAAPVPWGLAIGSNGRVFVTLENGQVLCFG
ncbi:MAG: PQQ-binding-like beta-propeller repeat protein [Candidatus Latescibacteria bacterium]|nr:PQQ-binding-like beta-propeller repeat protein [Candidatus Latescibacterota bacterium]